MGNLITALMTVSAPATTHLVYLPILFHPKLLGGSPFKPSSARLSSYILQPAITFFIIWSTSVVSGIMTTLEDCNRFDILVALKNSLYVLIPCIFGYFLNIVIPVLKICMSSLVAFLPWFTYIIDGVVMLPFAIIGGFYANSLSREKVCENKTSSPTGQSPAG